MQKCNHTLYLSDLSCMLKYTRQFDELQTQHPLTRPTLSTSSSSLSAVRVVRRLAYGSSIIIIIQSNYIFTTSTSSSSAVDITMDSDRYWCAVFARAALFPPRISWNSRVWHGCNNSLRVCGESRSQPQLGPIWHWQADAAPHWYWEFCWAI